jgi:hypothetical protein
LSGSDLIELFENEINLFSVLTCNNINHNSSALQHQLFFQFTFWMTMMTTPLADLTRPAHCETRRNDGGPRPSAETGEMVEFRVCTAC